MTASPGVDECHSYVPPKSLWHLVEKSVMGHEREEIKKILGISLVEQSIELQEEIQSLLEIWRDYRRETQGALSRTRLPEPPNVRQRLKEELRFFVESLRQKAAKSGRDSNAIFTRHNTEVIDYALGNTGRHDFRIASQFKAPRSGQNTPDVPSAVRFSRASHLSEDVEAMNKKFNYLKVDDIADHLREALEIEVSYLLEDVVFLQASLEEEANYRCLSSLDKVPTLKDLREERSKLEKEFLFSESSALSETSPENFASSPPTRRLEEPSKKLSTKPGTCHTGLRNQVAINPSHEIPAQGLTKSAKLKRQEQSGLGIQAKDHEDKSGRKASGDSFTNLFIDGTILAKLKSEPAAHMSIRTSGLTKNAKLVNVASIQSPLHENQAKDSEQKTVNVRRSSAQKFRSMVLECRDTP